MRLSPIPRSVLTEDVMVRVPAEGTYGGEHEGPEWLHGVRIEPAEAMTGSGYVLSDGCRAVMYVDARNSSGLVDVPVGSLVEWRGESMQAVRSSRLEAFGEVHHWEVELA